MTTSNALNVLLNQHSTNALASDTAAAVGNHTLTVQHLYASPDVLRQKSPNLYQEYQLLLRHVNQIGGAEISRYIARCIRAYSIPQWCLTTRVPQFSHLQGQVTWASNFAAILPALNLVFDQNDAYVGLNGVAATHAGLSRPHMHALSNTVNAPAGVGLAFSGLDQIQEYNNTLVVTTWDGQPTTDWNPYLNVIHKLSPESSILRMIYIYRSAHIGTQNRAATSVWPSIVIRQRFLAFVQALHPPFLTARFDSTCFNDYLNFFMQNSTLHPFLGAQGGPNGGCHPEEDGTTTNPVAYPLFTLRDTNLLNPIFNEEKVHMLIVCLMWRPGNDRQTIVAKLKEYERAPYNCRLYSATMTREQKTNLMNQEVRKALQKVTTACVRYQMGIIGIIAMFGGPAFATASLDDIKQFCGRTYDYAPRSFSMLLRGNEFARHVDFESLFNTADVTNLAHIEFRRLFRLFNRGRNVHTMATKYQSMLRGGLEQGRYWELTRNRETAQRVIDQGHSQASSLQECHDFHSMTSPF